MPSFPYFGFPNYRYNQNYSYGMRPSNNYKQAPDINNNISTSAESLIPQSTESMPSSSNEDRSHGKEDDFLFDLFGLKIYFDDILIVGLLFFLYNEGVKDEGLFIALILLLLT